MIQIHEHYKLPLDEIAEEKKQVSESFRRYTYFITGKAPAPRLTKKKELELLAAAKSGCQAASDKIVKAFSGFLESIAHRVAVESGCPELKADLYSVTLDMLLSTIPRFDLESNARFSTYLRFRVVGDLRAYALRNGRPIAQGTSANERTAIYQKRRLLRKFKDEFRRPFNETESDYEKLSELSGLSVGALKRGMFADRAVAIPAHHIEILDPGPSIESLIQRSAADDAIKTALDALRQKVSPRDYDIMVSVHADDPASSEALAAKYGITRERVGQIIRSNGAKMREDLRNRGIESRADLT